MTKVVEQWRQGFVHFWKYYLPPARASPSDLEFIKKKILEKGKDVKVLILGSTSEYRNICGELGIPVTCFDFSEYNYNYLKDEVKKMPQERYVNGNWFTHKLDEQFDIILGDVIINLQDKKKLPNLFRNIASWLKPNGLFMPRTYIRDKDETCTAEEAIKRYRKKTGQRLYTGSTRDLYLAGYDFEKETVNFRKLWAMLIDLHAQKIVTDEEFEDYKKLSFDTDMHFYMPIREEFDKLFEEFFTIKEIIHGPEPYLKERMWPLHVLTTK